MSISKKLSFLAGQSLVVGEMMNVIFFSRFRHEKIALKENQKSPLKKNHVHRKLENLVLYILGFKIQDERWQVIYWIDIYMKSIEF